MVTPWAPYSDGFVVSSPCLSSTSFDVSGAGASCYSQEYLPVASIFLLMSLFNIPKTTVPLYRLSNMGPRQQVFRTVYGDTNLKMVGG